MTETKGLMLEIGKRAREAAWQLCRVGTRVKNDFLLAAAKELEQNKGALLEANGKDLALTKEEGASSSILDRLLLNSSRIEAMAASLREVAALPDPVGQVTKIWTRPNGLKVGRMRIPLGVIGIIYEARPNVTVEAAALCVKSGNTVILKGGREALNSNLCLGKLFADAGRRTGLPEGAVQVVPTVEREAVQEMLTMEDFIDLIIPRGGEGLIRFVAENSRIPVIKHYKGVCHVFVDASAEMGMAEEICFNAKVQRPSVCNAMETLLVHKEIAPRFLPQIAERLSQAGVEIRGCPVTLAILPQAEPATEEDWYAEYLDLILAVRVVDGVEKAMDHIVKYGSKHTEAIVTRDYDNAQRFLEELDSSVVLVNASTRFSDGFELGLGAEIGISTTKVHAFGPMGLEELTTQKFIVYGQGQTRS